MSSSRRGGRLVEWFMLASPLHPHASLQSPREATVAIAAVIACNQPRNAPERVWCHGSAPPTTAERGAVEGALRRMIAQGSTCARLAMTITLMLEWHRMRLYDGEALPEYGAVTIGGEGAQAHLLLSRELLLHFADAAHRSVNVDSRGTPRPETLQTVLAHEADHILGFDHLDPDGYLTLNSERCGDVR